jgi:DNA invertase Pin-like site-specific DNA recombinase
MFMGSTFVKGPRNTVSRAQDIISMYVDGDMSTREIATALALSHTTVLHDLNKCEDVRPDMVSEVEDTKVWHKDPEYIYMKRAKR